MCAEHVPAAPYTAPAWERNRPATWLYLSKRLELLALPNEPLWCQPAISIGATVYYRLTPNVLYWLDCAGRTLEAKHEAGAVGRDQVDAFCEAMAAVYPFAAAHIDPTACEQARALPPTLPDAPRRISEESI